MAQLEKPLATKPDDWSPISGINMVEGENQLNQLSSVPHATPCSTQLPPTPLDKYNLKVRFSKELKQ